MPGRFFFALETTLQIVRRLHLFAYYLHTSHRNGCPASPEGLKNNIYLQKIFSLLSCWTVEFFVFSKFPHGKLFCYLSFCSQIDFIFFFGLFKTHIRKALCMSFPHYLSSSFLLWPILSERWTWRECVLYSFFTLYECYVNPSVIILTERYFDRRLSNIASEKLSFQR